VRLIQTKIRVSGFVLPLFLLGAADQSAIVLAQSSGAFKPTGSMIAPRVGHTATLLPGGKVLVAGGGSATMELYDPATGTFTSTATTASATVGSATLLPDGTVLLIESAQTRSLPPSFLYTKNAELYDPSTGTVTATGSMIDGQTDYTATLLTSGKVLIIGGNNTDSPLYSKAANPELYDPSTHKFSLAGPYADTGARAGAGASGLIGISATLLPDGNVLIASESAAEIFDPVSSTFHLTASMAATFNSIFGIGVKPDTLEGRTATLLLNGMVLLTGGEPVEADFDTGYPALKIAELYDFPAATATPTGNMTASRYSHAATLLTDGTVLITGGIGFSDDSFFLGGLATAELYDSSSGKFTATGAMTTRRTGQTATLLNDGRVLISGGAQVQPGSASPLSGLSTAELYTPAKAIPAPALFSVSGDGRGQGAVWHALTGQIASADSPAIAGEALSMYTTSLADGSVIAPQIAIGGRLAQALYFGPAPDYPGYSQVNFLVPDGLLPGSAVPIRLTYMGRSSNTVTISVR
jgi:hypothetical protein